MTDAANEPIPLTVQHAWADRCGIDRDDERAIEPHLYGWPDKYAIFRDGWDAACMDSAAFLKDGETTAECIARNRKDADMLLGELAKERLKCEALEREVGFVRTAYDQLAATLKRLYDAFPDCEGGEAGAACKQARSALSATGRA